MIFKFVQSLLGKCRLLLSRDFKISLQTGIQLFQKAIHQPGNIRIHRRLPIYLKALNIAAVGNQAGQAVVSIDLSLKELLKIMNGDRALKIKGIRKLIAVIGEIRFILGQYVKPRSSDNNGRTEDCRLGYDVIRLNPFSLHMLPHHAPRVDAVLAGNYNGTLPLSFHSFL